MKIHRRVIAPVPGILFYLLFLVPVSGAETQTGQYAFDRFETLNSFSEKATSEEEALDGWRGGWKQSQLSGVKLIPAGGNGTAQQDWPAVLIRGTGGRNNPLRRQLQRGHQEAELFVGFRFVYEPADEPESDDPEFFVLWLDRTDGSDQAVHNAGVPNIGIHRADRGPSRGKNVFMLRIGSQHTAWSQQELIPGKTYRLIARVAKETPGERSDYSQLQLWINPEAASQAQPQLTLSRQTGIHQIGWLGFATGVKTEPEDRIRVGDVVVSSDWESAYRFLQEASGAPLEQSPDIPPEVVWNQPVDFQRDVYPLLKNRCFQCHAGEYPDSGYRLDVRSELLGYSTGQALVVPGNSRNNPLLHVITTQSDSERMPPEGKPLSQQEVALLKAWIDQGLDWDDELLPEPQTISEHWAFQRVERPRLPAASPSADRNAEESPVDLFLQARWKAAGLTPAPPVDRRVLIRRLYLNVLGLPPTEAEVTRFLAAESPTAYQDLVDEVLASPHAAERLGRLWLDLVRWGESEGHQHDIPRPFAWRYRDYVISSFHANKPFDQFLREQLAGDELTPASDEAVIATGFLASARISGNQLDKKMQRTDVLFDIVDNTASALLGLTLECAQCHNHKFEPITQRDYFRFLAFFARGQMGNLKLQQSENPPAAEIANWFTKGSYDFYLREAKKLKVDPAEYPAHTWGYYSPVTGNAAIEYLPVVNRSPLPYSPEFLRNNETHILVRGDVNSPGLRVEPGWPAVLGTIPSELQPTPRQALADWLGSRENPLVARVWVNRLWQLYFGRGLVATSSDFGTHGSAPSHPELLDWLAVELMESGWNTRHIQRLLLNSHAFQLSSQPVTGNLQIDPENVFLWRWSPRRLQAEAIRDSLLVVTGELNRRIGGPSVAPQHDEQELRRTIYLSQRRSELPDVMRMFDGPEALRSCSRRETSTVALQPLYLLNSPFVIARARKLSSQILAEAGPDEQYQIERAFVQILGRPPEPSERERSLLWLAQAEETPAEQQRIFTQFCHSLMNLNEFVYLP